MTWGARTPEELDALLEDAFVLRDRRALAALFEDGAVLTTDDPREARGPEQIAELVTALWQQDRTYLAEPRRVIQARNTALVVADRGLSVMRRGSDRFWRYAISLPSFDHPPLWLMRRRTSDPYLKQGDRP